MIDNKSGRLIGNTRYYDLNPSAHSIAIGYTFLGRDYWGGIFNRAMKSLLPERDQVRSIPYRHR
ncbi:hypothetical protein [Leptospira kirschneri]|uniref:Uncharacterized protein n=2 Tax=Leptospira kirschneri TaxID=29507 RepID=A0A0E2AY80_9LEPT|nr:hypothetical protein [Leptospira kirschneri]EKO13887.1 hypothetical protein LEP1GSC081_3068 [Leptospira kirschneri str. H1]EKO59537.1 hypothetical protein LEP1GSC082_2264 [Leptospira kirschneri str. H2]EMK24313.1 hypothetical protein LEP1GSC008_0445 [Leptospira kirschneri serovar Bulgarica str. Nikolaevo]UML80423.1 hypothetical protein FH602_19615 [Leptospira kirschneri]